MVDALEASNILNKLADMLNRRRPEIDKLDAAYRGDFRLRFASDHFREYVQDRYENFNDNWCGIVADAPHERLEVTGIRLPGEQQGDGPLWDDWRRTDSDVMSDLAFLDAINCKRAFALVWGRTGSSGDDEPLVTWEHPSQAIVDYDPETRERRAGAKVWSDDTHDYATLYLPDQVWKFQRPKVSSLNTITYDGEIIDRPTLAGGWDLRAEGTIPNPFGKVPLVEIANRPRLLGPPMSDITGTMAMQDAINLFWSELLAVADEATIGQRLVLGAEKPVMPILDEDGNVVGEKEIDLRKWRRDRIAWIEDPAAKAFEWQPAKLEPFTNVIEIAVGHIAAQTRTPAHYLLIGGTMANVSADAMKALETGLVKRTQEKTTHFGRAVRDVFELIALARGDRTKARGIASGLVLWKDVENRSDAQLSDAALKDSQIGLPMRYILERRYNLPPAEIERVMRMAEQENVDPVLSRIISGRGANDEAAVRGFAPPMQGSTGASSDSTPAQLGG